MLSATLEGPTSGMSERRDAAEGRATTASDLRASSFARAEASEEAAAGAALTRALVLSVTGGGGAVGGGGGAATSA